MLCRECDEARYRDTLTDTCKLCKEQAISTLLVWSIILATVAVLAYPVWLCYGWAKEKGYLGGGDGDGSGGGDDDDSKAIMDNCTTVFMVSRY